MAFLNPILLLGTAGIGIPILIHLLNRRRFRKMPWAAMRYLRASIERNQRRMKLQDWILLAVRCLLLALIAFALARPSLKGLSASWLGSEVNSVVMLDRSASMARLERDGTSRFDGAKAVALEVSQSVPAGSAASLVLLPDTAPVAEESGDWGKRLGTMKATSGFADLSTAIPRALASLASLPAAQKELVIITDRQQDNWGDIDTMVRLLQDASGETNTHIILVGDSSESGRQLGITDLTASQSLPVAGRPLRFAMEITNHGTEDAADVVVGLMLDDEPLEDSLQVGNIPAGETVVAQVHLTIKEAGYHYVTASLPGDTQPMDDQRTTVLHVLDAVRLLLVDGSPGVAPAESEVYYLRHALETMGAEVSVIAPSQLSESAVENVAAVFIANAAEFRGAEILSRYVSDGGGVVIFPGDQTNADFYNRELAAFLPAMIGDSWIAMKRLQGTGYSHPVAAPWNDSGFGSLTKPLFREGLTLTLPKDSAQSLIALEFDDGSPALVERAVGLGRAFLFASTADKAWNDLPMAPVSVPLLSRIVSRILLTGNAALHLEAGTPFERQVAPGLSGKTAVVFPLNGSSGQGSQTSITPSGDGAKLAFRNTLAAGAYEATIDGQERVLFAVVPAPRELASPELTPAQLSQLRSAASVTDWKPGTAVDEIIAAGRVGTELWKVLLGAAMGLAVMEIMLAQRFSRSK